MSHTKGPWKVGGTADVRFYGQPVPVTEISSEHSVSWIAQVLDENPEMTANACLIAAAPAMLAELQKRSAEMLCICKFKDWTGQECVKCSIDAVISDATGGRQ